MNTKNVMGMKQWLSVLFILSLMTSCLKDEGNYDYEILPEFYIDTVGEQTSFEILQSFGSFTIDPKIVFEGDKDELSYQWRLYAPNSTFDTLTTQKVLTANISYAPGDYVVELQVTKKADNISSLMRYNVKVVSAVPSGWMVAYEKDGNTDVDLIRASEFISGVKDTVYRNIFSKVNGALAGTPTSILYLSSSISYVFTNTGGAKVQNTDFARVQGFNQLFVGTPPSIVKPEAFTLGSFNSGVLVNSGDVYWFNSDFAAGKVTLDDKGYQAAPFIFPIFGKSGGFYDQLNMRFGVIEQQTSQGSTYANASSSARFNLNNIGKKLLFVERGFDQASTGDVYKYAFFKDPIGDGRYLYVINTAAPSNPDVAAINISNAPDILNAKFYGVGNLGPCAFYATSSKIYNFQINYAGNTISTPTIGFQVNPDEEITAMRLFKGQGTFGVGAISSPNESRFLYTATWNETKQEGTVYLHSVNITSGVLGSQPLKKWTVAGKVKEMSYKQI